MSAPRLVSRPFLQLWRYRWIFGRYSIAPAADVRWKGQSMEVRPEEIVEALNFSNGELMALKMLVRQLLQTQPAAHLAMSRAVEKFKDAPQFNALTEGERAGFLRGMKGVL